MRLPRVPMCLRLGRSGRMWDVAVGTATVPLRLFSVGQLRDSMWKGLQVSRIVRILSLLS